MPELDKVPYAECVTADFWEKEVGNYTVRWDRFSHKSMGVLHDWSCTCDGYKYRKHCKHIDEVRKERCGWMEFVDGGKPIRDKCPKCGQKTNTRMWGV